MEKRLSSSGAALHENNAPAAAAAAVNRNRSKRTNEVWNDLHVPGLNKKEDKVNASKHACTNFKRWS